MNVSNELLQMKNVNNKNWFALYTKPRWEKKISERLDRKGVISWCPLKKTEKQWTDRKKIIEEPLFRSYVFVQIDKTENAAVLNTEGVLNFVHYLGKPAIIQEEEINNIKMYLAEKDARISIIRDEGFQEGDKIRVKRGVFMDKEGVVMKGGKKKAYVLLKTLGQVMVVEFPSDYLIPL